MKIETVKLWDESEYQSENDFLPYMDIFLLDTPNYESKPDVKRPDRPFMLICPGGGYGALSKRETEAVAFKFTAEGYHTGVVYYSIAPKKHPQPIFDVAKAILILREKASGWHIDTNKIAVSGFSAGGHLAASISCLWQEDFLREKFGIDNSLLKPNLCVLAYSVISSGEYAHVSSFDNLVGEDQKMREYLSLENRVTKDMPPTFLWHTITDAAVPVKNSLLFAEALSKNKIEYEMHLYPRGGHGLSIAQKETAEGGLKGYDDEYIASWVGECLRFIKYKFEL